MLEVELESMIRFYGGENPSEVMGVGIIEVSTIQHHKSMRVLYFNLLGANIFSKEGYLRSDLPKGDHARVPVKLLYRRAWRDQRNQVNTSLQRLREFMLIWCRSNLVQGF